LVDRLRLSLLILIVASLVAGPVAHSLAEKAPTPAFGPVDLVAGKKGYRQFCGQCHALAPALAAGFGSDHGLGNDGGPSFNNLKVPYNLSMVAVTGQFDGHALVVKRMTWKQLSQVAAFVDKVTQNHSYLAKVTDG
jgi:mono/diheme cytochrome c family protein